jgi:hypothetical protein
MRCICQLVLHQVFLAKHRHLINLHEHVLKGYSVALLPYVPQKVDDNSIKLPSPIFVNFCSTLTQVYRDPVIPTVSITERPSHCLMIVQTCFVKTQSLQRCVGVSGSTPQSLHIGSFGQFRFDKLFAVKIFLCSNV